VWAAFCLPWCWPSASPGSPGVALLLTHPLSALAWHASAVLRREWEIGTQVGTTAAFFFGGDPAASAGGMLRLQAGAWFCTSRAGRRWCQAASAGCRVLGCMCTGTSTHKTHLPALPCSV